MADLESLPVGSGSLSLLTNDHGGIIDDCIVTRTGPQDFFIVSNAGCADKDLRHLRVRCPRRPPEALDASSIIQPHSVCEKWSSVLIHTSTALIQDKP